MHSQSTVSLSQQKRLREVGDKKSYPPTGLGFRLCSFRNCEYPLPCFSGRLFVMNRRSFLRFLAASPFVSVIGRLPVVGPRLVAWRMRYSAVVLNRQWMARIGRV